jgi:hypothetical protein
MASQNANRKTNLVVKYSDFDVKNITISKIKSMDRGKLAYVNYNGKPFYLQTPEMVAPGGVQCWAEKDENDKPKKNALPKYDLRLSFNENDGPEVQEFHEKMMEFDEFMYNFVSDPQNCLEWTDIDSENFNRVMFNKMYTNVVKKSVDKKTRKPDGKYPDSMKIKLPAKFEQNEEGDNVVAFDCSIFDAESKQEVDTAPDIYVTKGSRVTAIVQCVGVWLVGGGIHPSFKLRQAKVSRPDSTLSNEYSFLDDDTPVVNSFTTTSENIVTTENTSPPQMAVEQLMESAMDSDGESVASEDSDNDDAEPDEAEAEPEPEPEPEQPVRRTRARAKATTAGKRTGRRVKK